jgi:SAM-dependent methyltransferase
VATRSGTSDGAAPGTTSVQAQHNLSEWASGKYVRDYANRVLSPVEVQILVRYSQALRGRVLDLGCGAGRVLSYLLMLGADVHGVDLAPAMVEYCHRTLPSAHVVVGDVGRLEECVSGVFDAVIAPDNLIDVFDDAERRRVLAGWRNFIAPDGLLIFSTHDLGWVDAHPGKRSWETSTPTGLLKKLLGRSPAQIAEGLLRRRRVAGNRRRLAPLEERHSEYAILNDFPHDYSLLHYYIRRDAQERQLQELGYELIECLDGRGDVVEAGGHAPSDHYMDNLHYIARPLPA